MADWTVAELAQEYTAGRLSRRRFVGRLLGAGLTMPLIAGVLQACGSKTKNAGESSLKPPSEPATQTAQQFQPAKRGGGGTLSMLWSQAPVILNAHIGNGTKDWDASRLFTEPLAAYDPQGEVFPVLAAETPSVDKGTLDRGGKWVTWRLKPDVGWHDGRPFTAEDVVFTWQYVMDEATAAVSRGNYTSIDSVEAVDPTTVKITFKEPTAFWQAPFVGNRGHIFPKHLLQPYIGQNARNSPYNLKPVGTGPYKFVDFRPEDVTIGEINDKYHVPNRPFFDRVELKGGGDSASAARAVLQTGEMDFAWNVQVEPDILANLERGGIGRVVVYRGSSIESVRMQYADPWTEVDGERASAKSKHPFFSDLRVRQATVLAVNRKLIVDELYGPTGEVGLYMLFNPKKYAPDGGAWEFNLQKAAALLDEAGWRRGSDGVRAKDGKRMKVEIFTSILPVRQKTQAIMKKDMESIGFEVELKAVPASVIFSSDPANPDTASKFWSDMQLGSGGPDAPDPLQYFRAWHSTQVSQKSNQWARRNIDRYQSPAYDALWDQAEKELDPVKRADLFKKMNQMVIDEAVALPLVARAGVAAAKKNLQGMDLSAWDSNLWKLPYWYRTP